MEKALGNAVDNWDLVIAGYSVYPHHLECFFKIQGRGETGHGTLGSFTTKLWYPGLNLCEQIRIYGQPAIDQVFSLICLFEGSKFVTLRPHAIYLQNCRPTVEAIALFTDTFHLSYSQCLYENKALDYRVRVIPTTAPPATQPLHSQTQSDAVLLSNGGGKDSYLMMQMLEDSGIPYDVYQWARSEYGLLGDQHALCDKIVPPGKVVHRISISDDFSRGPFADIYFPQEKDAMTLGSPESLFAAIPIFLAEGYRTFLVGNERSSDTPNLVYDGQDINHQWIKSLEAEWLFQGFLSQLLPQVRYSSLLKPIGDLGIFERLRRYPVGIPHTHSCNNHKPWCLNCPKCAYVLMGYRAMFGKAQVEDWFPATKDLLSQPQLQPYFEELLGLRGHRSFECVGEIDESRYLLHLCYLDWHSHRDQPQEDLIALFERMGLGDLPLSHWQALRQKYICPNVHNSTLDIDLYSKVYGKLL